MHQHLIRNSIVFGTPNYRQTSMEQPHITNRPLSGARYDWSQTSYQQLPSKTANTKFHNILLRRQAHVPSFIISLGNTAIPNFIVNNCQGKTAVSKPKLLQGILRLGYLITQACIVKRRYNQCPSSQLLSLSTQLNQC